MTLTNLSEHITTEQAYCYVLMTGDVYLVYRKKTSSLAGADYFYTVVSTLMVILFFHSPEAVDPCEHK